MDDLANHTCETTGCKRKVVTVRGDIQRVSDPEGDNPYYVYVGTLRYYCAQCANGANTGKFLSDIGYQAREVKPEGLENAGNTLDYALTL